MTASAHGPHGYVICRHCQQEAQDISKETGPEYAYHVHHRPSELAKTQARLAQLKKGPSP